MKALARRALASLLVVCVLMFACCCFLSFSVSAAGGSDDGEQSLSIIVASVEVTQAPDKAIYVIGEALDLTGGLVKITYTNGVINENVPMTAAMISGFDSSEAGTITLTVFAGDGESDSFDVTISAASTVMLGDVNGDKKCDSEDLTLIAKHVAKIETITGDAAIAGDVTKDGKVDSEDLTKVAKYVAKIIQSFD